MLIHISRPDALISIKVLPLGRRVGGGDQGNIKKQDLTPKPIGGNTVYFERHNDGSYSLIEE